MFFGVVMVIVSVALLYGAFRSLRMKRLLENMPTSTARGLAMGLVELKGTVVKDKELFTSPLLQKPCVQYNFLIQEMRGSGKSRRWVTVRSKNHAAEFFVKDATGKVRIVPEKADFTLEQDYEAGSKMFVDPPKEVLACLKREELDFEGLFGINKEMRYTETLLAPGDEVFVLGTAQTRPLENGNEETVVAMKKGTPFVVTDKQELSLVKKYTLAMGFCFFFGILTLVFALFLLSQPWMG